MEQIITATILGTFLILALILTFILAIMDYNTKLKERELKNQFLEKLNDHEKAVILTYINIKPKRINFKKKKNEE